jgi:ABC-type uncharacterized transport system involved in gliding motility auxiliary subunit
VAFRHRDEIEARTGIDIGRRTRRGAGSLSYTALVIVAVAMVLGVSIKVRHRWDISVQGTNTLSAQTRAVLASIQGEVWIYPLFTTSNPRRTDYWRVLELYREASPNIRVEFIDPVARPGEVHDLGLDPQQDTARKDGTTVVVHGENKRMFEGIGEEDVTNAVMDVTRSAPRVVGFVRGYGERDPESKNDAGLSHAVAALRQEYYHIANVTLAEGIPREVNVLIVAGIRMPIVGGDFDRLSSWLEGGGRLLVLADPGADPGINKILERWGLRFPGGQVLEPRQNLNNDPQFVKATSYSKHEVVKGFGSNFLTFFPVVERVEHFEPSDPLVYHDDLVLSSPVSSAIVDGERVAGPFALAAASWRREPGQGVEKETRVVIVGDTDFITNQFLYFRSNRNLFLNCVGWLSREESLVSIRRPPLAEQVIELESGDRNWMLLAAYGLPALVFVVQLAVWIRRRRL